MGRILAVDYGRKRIGLAVSDELGLTAQGLPTAVVSSGAGGLDAVIRAASRWALDEIVVGLPLNMDGSRGPMAREAEAFAASLGESTGLPVVCWDERLTSASAHRALQQMGQRARKDKGAVDRIAATILLEGYLQMREGPPENPRPDPLESGGPVSGD